MAVSDQPTPAADSAEDLAESASPQAGDSAPAPESGAPAGGAQQASTGLRVRVDFRAGQVELPPCRTSRFERRAGLAPLRRGGLFHG